MVLHPDPRKVLILGAGSGNGVAAALRHGAAEVVAVDIDPVIVAMGRAFHPERPYDSPKARVVIDGARSFLATAEEKFDVIAYEFLDAHTMATMTNARLDHYVYTRESFERARELLAEGGLVVLRFGYERPFIADRLARTLREVFGQEPLAIGIAHRTEPLNGLVFVAGDLEAARRQVAGHECLAAAVRAWEENPAFELPGTTRVATDDWPYLYLETADIPTLYYLMGAVLLVLFARSAREPGVRGRLRRWGRSQWHFFFLGAGFLLLEVQNVSKAAVVLGSTWQVTAVIISAVLALVLVANLIAARLPNLPAAPVYALLCASCLGLYFVDLSRFAFLPYATKAAVVGGLVSLPVLFGGIAFVRSFAAAARKDAALGANLFGSLVGGLLQSVTFITGIKALLLIVAGLYLLAWATRPGAAVRDSSE